jgi:putative methyltransferase (TIGR04325 family)
MKSKIVPSTFLKIIEKLKNRAIRKNYFEGKYSSFKEIKDSYTGYHGTSVYESKKKQLDYLLNYSREESLAVARMSNNQQIITLSEWPFIFSFLSALCLRGSKEIKVLDFGGNVGNHFFTLEKLSFCRDEKNIVNYAIVETEECLEAIKKLKIDNLRFFLEIDEAINFLDNQIDLFIASCSLPYVEYPYNILEKVKSTNPTYILMNRMPMISDSTDFCSIQHVNDENIFTATIPAWFFSKKKLLDFFCDYKYLSFEIDGKATLNNRILIENYVGYFFYR